MNRPKLVTGLLAPSALAFAWSGCTCVASKLDRKRASEGERGGTFAEEGEGARETRATKSTSREFSLGQNMIELVHKYTHPHSPTRTHVSLFNLHTVTHVYMDVYRHSCNLLLHNYVYRYVDVEIPRLQTYGHKRTYMQTDRDRQRQTDNARSLTRSVPHSLTQ